MIHMAMEYQPDDTTSIPRLPIPVIPIPSLGPVLSQSCPVLSSLVPISPMPILPSRSAGLCKAVFSRQGSALRLSAFPPLSSLFLPFNSQDFPLFSISSPLSPLSFLLSLPLFFFSVFFFLYKTFHRITHNTCVGLGLYFHSHRILPSLLLLES